MDLTQLNNPIPADPTEPVSEPINTSEQRIASQAFQDASSTSNSKRTSKDYRTLYFYLLSKFKKTSEESKTLSELETSLNKLIKYNELRNSMLLDLIYFIDREEITPTNERIPKNEEITRLKQTITKLPELDQILSSLLPLDVEADDLEYDQKLLDSELEKLYPRQELNDQCYLLETNPESSIYQKSEFEELLSGLRMNNLYDSLVPANTGTIKQEEKPIEPLKTAKTAETLIKKRKKPVPASSNLKKKQKVVPTEPALEPVTPEDQAQKVKNVILKFGKNSEKLQQAMSNSPEALLNKSQTETAETTDSAEPEPEPATVDSALREPAEQTVKLEEGSLPIDGEQ